MKLITTLLVAIAALGLAAEAGAAAKPPKQAKFKATLKGEQTTTWSYNTQPEAPCYGGENAGGSVRMFYESTKPAKVTALQVTKDSPLWPTFHRRVVFSPTIQAFATATIEGTHASGPVPQPDQCEDNGGGVIVKPPECGTGTALINATLGYVNKDRLLVQGDATSWDPGFTELRNLYGECPYWQTGPYSHEQAEGDLTAADVKLKEGKLFDAKGPKRIVLHGSQEDCYEQSGLSVCGIEEGPFRGKILTNWTLTLKRVG